MMLTNGKIDMSARIYYFNRVPHKTVGNRSQASASEGLYVAGVARLEREQGAIGEVAERG